MSDTPAKAQMPPIVIVSDGTSTGTTFFYKGTPLPFDDMHLGCYRGDYGECHINLTVQDVDEDGMRITRTLSLRKPEEN